MTWEPTIPLQRGEGLAEMLEKIDTAAAPGSPLRFALKTAGDCVPGCFHKGQLSTVEQARGLAIVVATLVDLVAQEIASRREAEISPSRNHLEAIPRSSAPAQMKWRVDHPAGLDWYGSDSQLLVGAFRHVAGDAFLVRRVRE